MSSGNSTSSLRPHPLSTSSTSAMLRPLSSTCFGERETLRKKPSRVYAPRQRNQPKGWGAVDGGTEQTRLGRLRGRRRAGSFPTSSSPAALYVARSADFEV